MWGLSFSRFESVRKSVRVWLDLKEEEEVCRPFKGKHPLKIFVVENIDPLQVTIHSYTNLFFGNHSITFISMVHSLETAKFETVPFTIQIFQKSPSATFTTSSP